MSGRWADSERRAELPPDWAARRQAVKARADGRCQAASHAARCNGVGAECDHIDGRHDHSFDNLQWLSHPCHAAKTQAEAQAAKPQRRRTPEPHPGRLR